VRYTSPCGIVPTSCHVVVARSVVEYPVARATSAARVNRKPFPSAGVSCVGSWTTTGAHDPRRSTRRLRIPKERFETSRLLVFTSPPLGPWNIHVGKGGGPQGVDRTWIAAHCGGAAGIRGGV